MLSNSSHRFIICWDPILSVGGILIRKIREIFPDMGIIDDIRIYSRVLTAREDVQTKKSIWWEMVKNNSD